MVNTKEFIELQQGNESTKKECKIATVVDLFDTGTAKIIFKGEDIPSEKEYSYLASYIPVVGDDVLLLPFIDTYIILGKVLFKETENKEEYVSVDSLNEILGNYMTTEDFEEDITEKLNDYAKKTDLDDYYQPGSSLITGNLKHQGSALSFFGNALQAQQSVSPVSTSAELSTVRTKLNELINALDKYGLV